MALGRQTLSGVRDSAGSYDEVTGDWADGGDTAFTISASVQPLSAEEMKSLPEGRRSLGSFNLFSDDILYTVQTSAGKNPDILTIYGKTYEVLSSEPWQNGLLNHYKSVVVSKS